MAARPQVNKNAPPTTNEAFLERLRIDQEPVLLLGQYFAQVAETVNNLGFVLSVEPIANLLDINKSNRDNWRNLFPAINTEFNPLDETNSFCLVVYDEAGEPVASGACRLYDWAATNYKTELESLRMFYAEPERSAAAFEECVVSAPSAQNVSGQIVYAGAAWCHPKVRGKSLSSLIPRTSKALALAKWDFDHMVGLMHEDSVKRGLAERFGYMHPELGALIVDDAGISRNFAVLAMLRDEVIEHIRQYSDGESPQVDTVIDRRLA